MSNIDLGDTLVIKRPTFSDNKINKLSHKHHDKIVIEEHYSMNPRLKYDDYMPIIKEKIRQNLAEIMKVFNTFDLEECGIVTKAELRRIMDKYCLPLTTNQFETFLQQNPVLTKHGSINYQSLLSQILPDGSYPIKSIKDNRPPMKLPNLIRSHTTYNSQEPPVTTQRSTLSSSCSRRSSSSGHPRSNTDRSWTYTVFNIDDLIPILQNKIFLNLDGLLRALRLFDFNNDHYIQKFRLKKVLENFCFSLSNPQFDKLLEKFAFSQSGSVNYVEFLRNIGIPLNDQGKLESTRKRNPIKVDGNDLDKSNIEKIGLLESGLVKSNDMEMLIRKFRLIIEEKFDVLKKAFFVLDSRAEGFVSIDQLHNVLNNFVFPLSDNVFQQIMNKCGFKVTGSLQWLNFLKKFQDPQSKNLNGMTFPTKSDLIVNSTKGIAKATSVDELIELLCHHISDHYPSFRNAFLKLNQTHQGKISKSEFMKILRQFNFQIQPSQVKMLFEYLDPNKRGFISYHNFLQLFEQKENLAGHKWLNSNHKVVEVNNNVVLTDNIIKTTLAQQMTQKWPELTREFHNEDPNGSGYLSTKKLKKIFNRLFNYLANENIDQLVEGLTMRNDQNQICYFELLNQLGVDPRPLDDQGISSQIYETNKQQLKQRQHHHMLKMNEIDKTIQSSSKVISTEELLVRLRDRLMQNRTSAYEVFYKYELKDSKGGISRKQLRKIIEQFNYIISDEQFHQICDQVGFPTKGRVDFKGFLLCFIDNVHDLPSLNHIESSPCFLPQSNHQINEIRGVDQKILNKHEIELWLRKQIANGYTDLPTAFHKLDTHNKGYVTKRDLRHLLDLHNLAVHDSEFNLLCDNLLHISDSTRLTYPEFLEIFQLKDDIELGHKWLNSQHRFNDLSKKTTELSAEEIGKLLPDKIHQHFHEKGPAFHQIVTSGTGYVTLKNFRDLLEKIGLEINKVESKRLWKMYDVENTGRMNYLSFLSSTGLAQQFSSDDTTGVSSQVIQASHDHLVDHLAEQELKQQQAVYNQAYAGSNLSIEALYDTIKRHIQITFSDISLAFKSCCGSRSLTGFLNLDDLNRLLIQLHLFVTNDRFVQLAARLGFKGPDDSINYEHFCQLFQDKIPPIDAQTKQHMKEIPKTNAVLVREAADNFPNEKLFQLIGKKLKEQLQEIKSTLAVLDKGQNGYVTVEQWRNLLTAFCVQLNERQFKAYLKEMSLFCMNGFNDSNNFDYNGYLQQFTQVNTDSTNTIPLLSDNCVDLTNDKPHQTSTKLDYKQVYEYIIESLKARPRTFLNMFKQRDYAMIGKISKKDFHEILEQLIFKMNQENFERFWLELNPNEFENLDYVDFLKKTTDYNFDQENNLVTRNNSLFEQTRPSTMQSQRSNKALSNFSDEDLDPVELIRKKLERVLNRHWQTIFQKCKSSEKCLTTEETVKPGLVDIDIFCKIISEYDKAITPDSLASLNLYQTLYDERYIRYSDLIRSIVLSSRGTIISQNSALDIQKKFDSVGIKTTSADGTRSYFTLLFKLRRYILENWKEMRKEFINQDKQQNNSVNANICMGILNKFCGRITPDLYYHLMTLYDNGQGRFNYKQFIESFLKTANN